MYKRFLKNISWLALANLATKPVWFLFITAACMRVLGVEEFGIMTASLSIGFISTAFVDLGASRFLIREIAADRNSGPVLLASFGALRIVSYVIAFVVSIVIALSVGYQYSRIPGLAYATLYAMAMNLTGFLRGTYQAHEDLKLEAVSLVFEKIAVIACGLLGLLLTRSATGTLLGMAVGLSFTAGANLAWINKHLIAIEPKLFSPSYIKRALPALLPLGLFGFLGVVYLRIDLVMIESMCGLLSAGQYATAFRIHEATFAIPTIVALAATYPKLSSLFGSSRFKSFERLIIRSSVGCAFLALIPVILISLFGDQIIALLDPDPLYAPAARALTILTWSLPLVCINAIMYSAFIAMSKERLCVVVLIGLSLMNITLNYFLITSHGIAGASSATLICEIILTMLLVSIYFWVRGSAFAPHQS